MSAYDGPDRRAASRAPARLEAAYEDAERQIFLQTALAFRQIAEAVAG